MGNVNVQRWIIHYWSTRCYTRCAMRLRIVSSAMGCVGVNQFVAKLAQLYPQCTSCKPRNRHIESYIPSTYISEIVEDSAWHSRGRSYRDSQSRVVRAWRIFIFFFLFFFLQAQYIFHKIFYWKFNIERQIKFPRSKKCSQCMAIISLIILYIKSR